MAEKGRCSPSKVSLIIDEVKQKLRHSLCICEDCDTLSQPNHKKRGGGGGGRNK